MMTEKHDYAELRQAIVDAAKDSTFIMKQVMANVVIAETDEYRKKPLQGDEETFLKEVRVGKRDNLIFVFEPVDASPYRQIEFVQKDVNKGVKNFDAFLAKVFPDQTLDAMKESARRAAASAAAMRKLEEEAERTERYEEQSEWGRW